MAKPVVRHSGCDAVPPWQMPLVCSFCHAPASVNRLYVISASRGPTRTSEVYALVSDAAVSFT